MVARLQRGVQPVQGRIRHKRHPSRGAGPCHLFRSSLEPVAPRAEKVTGLWRLIAAMLVPRTAANQVPKSGQWGVLAHFRAKLTKILKQTLFVGQRLTTRFIEAHAEVRNQIVLVVEGVWLA